MLRPFMLVLVATIFPVAVSAQLSPEARQRALRDFELENVRSQPAQEAVAATGESEDDLGLAELRDTMTAARNAFIAKRNGKNREAVTRATVRYAKILLKLERYDEVEGQIRLSIELVGRQEELIRELATPPLEKGRAASKKKDWQEASNHFQQALRVAEMGDDVGLRGECSRALRDVLFGWARSLYQEGNAFLADDKAGQALLFQIDVEPIRFFRARLAFLRDDYPAAAEEAKGALKEAHRKDPEYLAFAEWIRRESYLEHDFRRTEAKGLVVAHTSRAVFDIRPLEIAFSKAREKALDVFSIETALPVRMSLYQRGDYFRFCEAPSWSVLSCVGGKIRWRDDLVRLGEEALAVAARYAFGLWVVDTLSEGRAPAWFAEGFAHQLALPNGPPAGGERDLRKTLSGGGEATDIKALESPFLQYPDRGDVARAMVRAQSLFQFLLEAKGLSVARRLCEAFREAPDAETALLETTGLDYTSLLLEWGEKMSARSRTHPFPDRARLKELGFVSPLGAYWEQ